MLEKGTSIGSAMSLSASTMNIVVSIASARRRATRRRRPWSDSAFHRECRAQDVRR
ncbi:hypothetical protein AM571_PC00867 (plasmid) [Rhizobium etli 8C-3]|uniref:Uncharacterized protein n=1 Tax=Rhizobium etli 8C-3 TaxID=538025 RepID=A0A1L5PEM2_RHIET|nr:hypothetical protein AM571_PC00867 [Rhizobium etli 8C-3]